MLRVLVIDDEPFIVQGISVLIDWEAEDCRIVGTAANGKEALEFLRQQEVDLIIADIQMPVMSGLELVEIIKTEKLSDAYFVILSGYNEFQYAQQALRYECLDYLLKPIQKKELTEVIHKVQKLYRRSEEQKQENRKLEKAYLARQIFPLLSGKYDQINLDYVYNHMKLSPHVRYIDIEIDELAMQRELSLEEKRRYQRQLYEKCLSCLGEEGGHCIFDVSSDSGEYDIGFIYCEYMAREAEKEERRYLLDLLEKISREPDIPVLMFAGSKVEDISEISESYRTAMIVKSFSMFHNAGSISYYEDQIQTNLSENILCKKRIDDLVQAVEQNHLEDMDQSVDCLYEEMNRSGMSQELIKISINYFLFRLIHLAVAQENQVSQEDILKYIGTGMFDKRNMRGSSDYLKSFVREYAEYLVQLRKDVPRGVLADVEREIKENYRENLTLKELSKKYYVNSAYLGQLFRKKYGMPFKDYLNNYRMNQAAVMLLRTDKKIYEIAETVGFHDVDYFINRFIAVKGCTPSKFRKQSGK